MSLTLFKGNKIWGGDMGSMHVQNLEVHWYVITLGDYIGPKKLPKYHRYRSNNRSNNLKKLKYDVEYIFCSLYICFLLLNWVNLYLVTVLNMSFLSIFSDMLKQQNTFKTNWTKISQFVWSVNVYSNANFMLDHFLWLKINLKKLPCTT